MEKNLISVVIPIYNVEPYLNRCVESVINQTYKNLEIILVDDGSPDNCPKMCDDWSIKDSRIKVIHKENGGIASARNAGLEAANGEFIGWVDSDDWIDENYFAILYDKLIEYHADIAVNTCDIKKGQEKLLTGEKILESFLWYKLGCVLWKTLAYSRLYYGEKFENYEIGEDQAMLLKLFEKSSSVICYNQEGYHYLVRDDSAMRNTNLIKMKNWLKTGIIQEEYVENKYLNFTKVCAFRKIKLANLIYHGTKHYNKTDELLEFWDELRKIIRQNVFKVPYYLLDFQQIKSVLSAIKFCFNL